MKALVLSLLAVAIISGCAQDQEPAELATEFKDHVSFILDSTEWTAQSDGSLSVIEEVITAEIGEEPAKRTFMLTAWNVSKGSSSSISLYADSLVIGQPIALNGGTSRASFTTKSAGDLKPGFLTSDAQNTGTLTVLTIDSASRRVTGTFDAQLGGRRITNGSFDARYTAPKPM
jgi:hypothetical protein